MLYSNAATLDTEPLAKSYSGGSSSRLSSNHFQNARAFFCYRAFVYVSLWRGHAILG
jgi:hypothetical protein